MALLLGGCELAGLDFQESVEYEYKILDPKVNMTAWEYINLPRQDTLFNMMVRGIKYAGLEDEYKKPNRTFLLHTWTVYLRKNANGTLNPAAYFAFKKVNGQNATSWKNYPVVEVRKFFLYHIIEDVYSFDNLKPDNTITTSLLPGPENTVQLLVVNDRFSTIRVNDFVNTKRAVVVRTSNIQATNGVAHVLDSFIEPGKN